MALARDKGWIAVDLDGTLSRDIGWAEPGQVGDPVPDMVMRVKAWLAAKYEVRIFTARVTGDPVHDKVVARYVGEWCLKHIGVVLPVTNKKDYRMLELWDDRAVQVETNTGKRVGKISTRQLVVPPNGVIVHKERRK